MPDPNLSASFLRAAKRLTPEAQSKPLQGNLRRAISSCYYAVYHALAKSCADCLVGATKERRPNKAWVEVYRGLSHNLCKDACSTSKNVNFPEEIHDFADAFRQLQDARENADYNPLVRPTKEDAQFFIGLAEQSIRTLKAVPQKDRKAFAAWVLITSPGAKRARSRMRTGDGRNLRKQ